jgi:hypothetical protein
MIDLPKNHYVLRLTFHEVVCQSSHNCQPNFFTTRSLDLTTLYHGVFSEAIGHNYHCAHAGAFGFGKGLLWRLHVNIGKPHVVAFKNACFIQNLQTQAGFGFVKTQQ